MSCTFQFCDAIVIKNYLIQLYAIDPKYATSIHALLPANKQEGFSMDEIKEASKTAHMVNKDSEFFSPDKNSSFMGMPFKRTTA